MKKNATRHLLRDLKAAAVLGEPEAIDIALDGLLAFPGVAANDPMNDGFIEKTILPVGGSLKALETRDLRPLLSHNLAAGRAVGAVALAIQFIAGKHATAKDLLKAANETRLDVRNSLGRALRVVGHEDIEKLFMLGSSWLKNSAPKPRYTALVFIPAVAESQCKLVVDLLDPIGDDPDWEVRAALVEALDSLARSACPDAVLELLTHWTDEPHPNSWVISRTLSASWAAAFPKKTEAILRALSTKTGTSSQVRSAVEALARHGVEIKL